jgi:RNA polymerase sigma-70 factor (ECF subfamily)
MLMEMMRDYELFYDDPQTRRGDGPQLPEARPVVKLDGSQQAAVSGDPDVARMLAFARGNEDAFVELYRTHRDRIVSFAFRMLGDQAQAEEAAQDVFLKLYRARDGYEAKSRFSTFLYRIATNHCLNQRARLDQRLVNRDRSAGDDHEARTRSQDQSLEHDELRQALRRALDLLPERQRAALLLVHYEGLSYHEAASAIDVTESALKSLIHRARLSMIAQLEPVLAPTEEARRAL